MNTGTVLFLTFHRILPNCHVEDSLSQRSLILTLESFSEQLSLLEKNYTVISMDEYFDLKDRSINRKRPYAVITFDDGWADNYLYALEVLYRAKFPATIYLASGYINKDKLFWPEKLAAFFSGDSNIALSKNSMEFIEVNFDQRILGIVENILQERMFLQRKILVNRLVIYLKKYNREVIDGFLNRLSAEDGLVCYDGISSDRLLTWEEVVDMNAYGVSFGSHTRSHAILTDLPLEEAMLEVVDSKKEIESETGIPILDFSFPDGQYNKQLATLVKESGYRSAVTGTNALSHFNTDPFALRRKGNNELRLIGKDGELSDALSMLEWSDTIGFFRKLKRNPYH
jgi:peptidoglycan/xylan/chitin deacetylase (PgdA/CDA1 family)